MAAFLLRRLATGAITIFAVATLCFVLTRSVKGSPFSGEKNLHPEIIKNFERYYGLDRPVFEQYLTTTTVPALEYRVDGGTLSYRWADVVTGFAMPVRVVIAGLAERWLRPTEAWQQLTVPASATDLAVDEDFYVTARKAAAGSADSGATATSEGRGR